MVTGSLPGTRAATTTGALARRAGWWAALIAVVVLAGVAIALGTGGGAPALDPTSTAGNGSKALAQVLAGYGVRLTSVDTLDAADSAGPGVLVVLDPDAYSADQLRAIARGGRPAVLLQPGTSALGDLPGRVQTSDGAVDEEPGCDLAAAQAAGPLDWPTDAQVYTGGTRSCYGGAVVAASSTLTVLGSSDVLTNDWLADQGIAALDVNLLSADRSMSQVIWLRPGPDAGSGDVTIWTLFPAGAYRAFLWLVLVGLVVVLWRARRLGPPVAEPLPVVVRSAELVEGHGRLYRRAGARQRAAGVLRAASLARLRALARLPAGSSALEVGAALGERSGRTSAQLHDLLAGPVPSDDAGLITLARELDALEAAVREGSTR